MFQCIRDFLKRQSADEKDTTGRDNRENLSIKSDNELQGLRLELREREQTIATLKQDLNRVRSNQQEQLQNVLSAHMEKFLSNVGAPITQLSTQIYLTEVKGLKLEAKDVLSVAKRIVRAFQDEGLTLLGDVGEAVSFDQNYHQPLNRLTAPDIGERAIVRIPGFAYRDKVLHKASVEKMGQ